MESSGTNFSGVKNCANISAVRFELVGLLVACPFNQDNPANCPLYYMRTRPLDERIEWLDKLADDDVEILKANHQHCLYLKERAQSR